MKLNNILETIICIGLILLLTLMIIHSIMMIMSTKKEMTVTKNILGILKEDKKKDE